MKVKDHLQLFIRGDRVRGKRLDRLAARAFTDTAISHHLVTTYAKQS